MKISTHVEPVSVSVRDLRKSYAEQEVLHGVSFDVEPGQIFVLMGPSGSGKSVLLRQVNGLEVPDSGTVHLNDLPADNPETHRRIRSALVFQAGALFNSMTVFENLALYHREHRLYTEEEIRKRVEGIAGALSVGNALNKIPAELSGGMRKRVAVARAILIEPQLMLYDEPTSELDPVLAATTSELIATVAKETGGTNIVVTHDRQLAMGIADRVALLLRGNLVFCGTPAEMENCEDPEVQEFLNPTLDLESPRFRKQENNS